LPVFADQNTKKSLLNAFEYIFKSKNMAQYPPICEIIEYEAGKTYQIDGFKIDVIKQNHGNMDSLGYVIDDKIAYNLDVKFFYDETYLDKIKEIECLIIGCLRYEEHPAHADYEQILKWIEYVKPKVTYLSHMTALIDYVTEYEKLSKMNIFPSYDGCVINL
jgi:phosphoribosyl 1,2-cyclic phosphate phosphodiesterase